MNVPFSYFGYFELSFTLLLFFLHFNIPHLKKYMKTGK